MKIKIKETEIAGPVVKYLQDLKWDVYQEVQVPGRGRADIVAVQGPVIWAIECKVKRSLEVLNQAWAWSRLANRVSIATSSRVGDDFYRMVVRDYGIGVLCVSCGGLVSTCMEPRLRRRIGNNLINSLHEGQKTYAMAGNNEGAFWSPYKQTCQNIRDYVCSHPGASLKEVVENIKTHYHTWGNAYQSLRHWLSCGLVKGVKMEKNGKRLNLYIEKISA